MRRVVSVFLPNFATDRLRKHGVTAAGPLVTARPDGNRRILAAVDAAAVALGLSVGMTLAQAQAMAPDLVICDADPTDDAAALRRLAGWCLRYAPLVAADPPDGVWLDITGCAHLQGGETALLGDLVCRLAAQGLTARAAVADTPGAAHAMARYGGAVTVSLPVGEQADALADLPIAALRLPAEIVQGLRLLGFERIGALAATPRAPLVRRFGPAVAQRLDQAMGTVFEPIAPEVPSALVQARLNFSEPLLTAEAFSGVIGKLVARICAALEQTGQGARRLDLLFERVDGAVPAIRIGTARATRDPGHLARMLTERLERIDPGLGVEAMRLVVPQADPLAYAQTAARLKQADAAQSDSARADIAPLVDRLGNRFGARRVYRAAPVESDVPERSVRRVAALAPAVRTNWPGWLPRPVRLLDPPQPVEAMALLPDHPPVAFTWRRVRHRVRRADGPERIAGEWWKRDGERRTVRDYFRVEDEEGRRFWLFRHGDGVAEESGDLRWFLHGFFGG